MEMLERCPGCSVAREIETKEGSSQGSPPPCGHCGYDGPFRAEEPARADSVASFAGARAKLATATQDLFRLSGSYSPPAESPAAEPPPVSAPAAAPASDGRRKESSMMFSLEALMRANTPPPKPADDDEVRSELWSLQAATPLFGTAHDQALLTTPLKLPHAPSMDSMTLPTQRPGGRRWLPAVLAACAGLALTAGGLWVYGPFSGPTPVNAATGAPEQASLAVEPPPAELAAEPTVGGRADFAAAEPLEAEPAAAEPVIAAAVAAAAPSDAVGSGSDGSADEASEPAAAGAEAAEPESKRSARVASAARKPAPRRAPPSRKPASAFDKDAARAALKRAAAHAAGCGQGGAPGSGKIQVTFAPSGRVTDARLVDTAFTGAAASSCVLRHFRAASVPAFTGSSVTVAKSFRID